MQKYYRGVRRLRCRFWWWSCHRWIDALWLVHLVRMPFACYESVKSFGFKMVLLCPDYCSDARDWRKRQGLIVVGRLWGWLNAIRFISISTILLSTWMLLLHWSVIGTWVRETYLLELVPTGMVGYRFNHRETRIGSRFEFVTSIPREIPSAYNPVQLFYACRLYRFVETPRKCDRHERDPRFHHGLGYVFERKARVENSSVFHRSMVINHALEHTTQVHLSYKQLFAASLAAIENAVTSVMYGGTVLQRRSWEMRQVAYSCHVGCHQAMHRLNKHADECMSQRECW